jgi:N-acylneuraminate cytidylyltransferase
MRIAVIPARGGSKRIPHKNIKPFRGKPMIAWSIEAARASGLFEHVVVSTDDDEIGEIARGCGAEVPFLRPPALADDHAGLTEVVSHATRWAGSAGWPLTAVCCILATSPFLRPADLARGLELLESGPWAYAFSATEYAAPIFRAFKRDAEDRIEMFFPEHFASRSQDLPQALHDAAQFYWGRPEAWLERKRIFDRHSTALTLPRWRVQDIDTEEDWQRAETVAPSIMAAPAAAPASTAAIPFRSDQEHFWATTYALGYIEKNKTFDHRLGAQAWSLMLRATGGKIASYLECGCNIGRNIEQLKLALPDAQPSVIEISEPAFKYVTARHRFAHAFNGAILDADFADRSFDLVFTMGVLIHINPDQLLEHMAKMFSYSSRYVLFGEYFSRTPATIEYQGETNKLFKRDFGKLFIENFPVKLLDYGFLWGHLYDAAGFDDITWWLFEKT